MSSVNDRGRWTAHENQRLLYLRRNHMEFQDIAQQLQDHSAEDCEAQYEICSGHLRSHEGLSKFGLPISKDEFQENELAMIDRKGISPREQGVAGPSARRTSFGKQKRPSTPPMFRSPEPYAPMGKRYGLYTPSTPTPDELDSEREADKAEYRAERRDQMVAESREADQQSAVEAELQDQLAELRHQLAKEVAEQDDLARERQLSAERRKREPLESAKVHDLERRLEKLELERRGGADQNARRYIAETRALSTRIYFTEEHSYTSDLYGTAVEAPLSRRSEKSRKGETRESLDSVTRMQELEEHRAQDEEVGKLSSRDTVLQERYHTPNRSGIANRRRSRRHGKSRKDERLEASERQILIEISWELPAFINEELDGNGENLLDTILLAASGPFSVVAKSCREYLSTFWPNMAEEIVRLLERVPKDINLIEEKRSDRRLKWVSGLIEGQNTYLSAKGTQFETDAWCDQLAWIAAACRPLGREWPHMSPSYTVHEDLKCMINMCPSDQLWKVPEGCWRDLFKKVPIAYGYPTPARPQQFEKSIELPFDLMTTLAGIRFPMEWHGGMVLMGYSTILVPSLIDDDCILWHLVASVDKYTPIHLDHLETNDSNGLYMENFHKVRRVEDLASRRTFLGFSPSIEIHLGTSSSAYTRMQPSGAPGEGTSIQVTSVSASIGSEGLGIFGAHISPNILMSKALRANMRSVPLSAYDRLKRAQSHPLLLYDIDTKRGFLVPELSVIFHLLHVWGTRHNLFNAIPFAPAIADGGRAVFEITQLYAELVLLSSHGQDTNLLGKVMQLLELLDQRREAQFGRHTETSGISLLSQKSILCWDCYDIIDLKTFPVRRRVGISSSKFRRGWPSLLRKSPDILALVCRGLGEPIRNAIPGYLCISCMTPPSYCNCITATVRCLRAIPPETWASSKLQWSNPDGHYPFQSCESQPFGVRRRIQSLEKQYTPAPSLSKQEDGAVLFVGSPSSLKDECDFEDSQLLLAASDTDSQASHQFNPSAPNQVNGNSTLNHVCKSLPNGTT